MTPTRIIAATAQHFGLTVTELLSRDRHKSLVRARQIAMWLCRQLTAASYPEIGRAFAKRDHTTVMHAVKSIERQTLHDATLCRAITTIVQSIGPDFDHEQTLEKLEMCA